MNTVTFALMALGWVVAAVSLVALLPLLRHEQEITGDLRNQLDKAHRVIHEHQRQQPTVVIPIPRHAAAEEPDENGGWL